MESRLGIPKHATLRAGARCLAAAAGLLLAACQPPRTADSGPRAHAEGEILEGRWADPDRSVAAFKGVPYAAPPVGERRWRAPAPVVPREGVRPAVEFGPRCPQSDVDDRTARAIARELGRDPALVPEPPAAAEDCLHLNVWTSNLGGGEPQPVMVWIHGGSNLHGGGDQIPYDGANLARRGVVVVTFNYRLGLLGYLAHPALTAESPHRSSGNYGLLDQVAALEWVRQNIAAFGGDPERVTLAGASTGGADALYLMASPLAAGLFHRAISQSGAPPDGERTLASQERRGVRLGELLEVSDPEASLEELRAVPVETLLEVGAAHLNEELDCAPVTDGWALPEPPARIFAAGKQHDVPLLIGWNADEWTSIGRYEGELSERGLDGWLRSYWGRWWEQAAAIYPLSRPEDVESTARRWQTDRWFACPTVFVARSMARVASDAWVYRFSRRPPGPGGERLGAYHGAELAYVFGNLDAESWVPREPVDRELAEAIAAYWVQFAATGDPNREGLPRWPPYYGGRGGVLELGDEIWVGAAGREQACRLWEQRLATRLELD